MRNEITSDTDPRHGWFKLLIPRIKTVFSGLFWDPRMQIIEPLPFIYGRLDPEQVSFDCMLSIPMLAIDRVVLVKVDDRPEVQQAAEAAALAESAEPSEIGLPIQMMPLKMTAMDQVNRCYIPVKYVTCIIPLDTRHSIVAALVQITSESGLIIPQGPGVTGLRVADPGGEPPKIVDLTGRTVGKPGGNGK